MAESCNDHLEYLNGTCPGCGFAVDAYGNTEADPIAYCAFPDCGCDGARLCMAGNPSARASMENVEGMYTLQTPEGYRARLRLARSILRDMKEKLDGS